MLSFPIPFFVQITCALAVRNLSNGYHVCSFFTISDIFCIDNAHAIGRKIRYVLVLHCHHQRAFLVPSESCSIEEQSIEYWMGVLCLMMWCVAICLVDCPNSTSFNYQILSYVRIYLIRHQQLQF
jgi:hypothetical protein